VSPAGIVDKQSIGVGQDRVGRNAVAFREDHKIAGHHVTTGNAAARPISDDQRSGTRKTAERLENALASRFLHDADRDGKQGKKRQYKRVAQLAQQQIDRDAAQQQREHRLAQDFGYDAQNVAAIGVREFVWPVRFQPLSRFRTGQTTIRIDIDHPIRHQA
jgi:hypothetical protein